MSWLFGDTYVTQTMNSIEIKVIAGVVVGIFCLVVFYGAIRLHTKFMKAKIEQTARREVRLNNVV